MRSPRTSTPATRPSLDAHARQGVDAHLAAVRLDEVRAPAPRTSRAAAAAASRAPRRARSGPNISREHARRRARRGFVRRLIQRRHGQRLPQPLASRRRLAVRRSHRATVIVAGIRHHGRCVRARDARRRSDGAMRSADKPIAPRQRVPPQHAGEQVQRRRAAAGSAAPTAGLAIEERHFERRLSAHVSCAPIRRRNPNVSG